MTTEVFWFLRFFGIIGILGVVSLNVNECLTFSNNENLSADCDFLEHGENVTVRSASFVLEDVEPNHPSFILGVDNDEVINHLD